MAELYTTHVFFSLGVPSEDMRAIPPGVVATLTSLPAVTSLVVERLLCPEDERNIWSIREMVVVDKDGEVNAHLPLVGAVSVAVLSGLDAPELTLEVRAGERVRTVLENLGDQQRLPRLALSGVEMRDGESTLPGHLRWRRRGEGRP